jgi:hypothetical protein
MNLCRGLCRSLCRSRSVSLVETLSRLAQISRQRFGGRLPGCGEFRFRARSITLESPGGDKDGSNSNDIVEFTPSGYESTFVTGLVNPRYMAFAPVPEPSTWLLTTIGMAGMWFVSRRKSLPRLHLFSRFTHHVSVPHPCLPRVARTHVGSSRVVPSHPWLIKIL